MNCSFVYTKELKHSIVLLILFAFLLTGCVSTAAGDTGPKGVLIESKADVGQNEVADFQASASETVKYYQEVGLFLKQPVTIVLTRNRKSFLAEAALRFGISEIEVNRVGKGVDALSEMA